MVKSVFYTLKDLKGLKCLEILVIMNITKLLYNDFKSVNDNLFLL